MTWTCTYVMCSQCASRKNIENSSSSHPLSLGNITKLIVEWRLRLEWFFTAFAFHILLLKEMELPTITHASHPCHNYSVRSYLRWKVVEQITIRAQWAIKSTIEKSSTRQVVSSCSNWQFYFLLSQFYRLMWVALLCWHDFLPFRFNVIAQICEGI